MRYINEGELYLTITKIQLAEHCSHQLKMYFLNHSDPIDFMEFVLDAFSRIESNFKSICLPYYRLNDQPFFNHLHGDHYLIFIYELSRSAFKYGNEDLATKLFLLNKYLHGIDLFYEIKLPAKYIFIHPIGSVIGRGVFNDKVVFYQGVTVGSNSRGDYPTLYGNNILFSNSSLIGDSILSSGCVMSAKSFTINSKFDADTIVTGSFPNNNLVKSHKILINSYFFE
jgi:serine O-acetyltransferase